MTANCARPRVAVCVLTYRRQAGLARLLGALGELRFPHGAPDLRVIVVDNDAGGSARGLVADLATRTAFPLGYCIEKRRGIPQARNAALAAAMGWAEYVAFLDDDEVPDPDWLCELLRTQRRFDADAVTGPCLSRFETEPPPWVTASGVFDRPRWPTGAPRNVAFTGNVLIRTRALAAMDELFDESLALTGGEDSEFFQRFVCTGHRIVWCDEALVHDFVPPACATLRWILARAYRAGAVESYILLKHRPGLRSSVTLLVHGGYCLAKAAALLLAASLRGRAAAAVALCLAGYGVGRLGGLLGLQYAEYRRVHGN